MKATANIDKALHISKQTVDRLDDTLDILTEKLDRTNQLLGLIFEQLSKEQRNVIIQERLVSENNGQLSTKKNTGIEIPDSGSVYVPKPNISSMKTSNKTKRSSKKVESANFDDVLTSLEGIEPWKE